LNFNPEKLSPKEQEELRKKIVRQMLKYGDTKEVSKICECSLRHVQSTWKKYRDGGVDAIKSVKMGRPSGTGRKLTPEQEAILIKILTEKSPDEMGLGVYLWDRKTVTKLVKQLFEIDVPLSTMGDYLARWNFTSQRPKKSCNISKWGIKTNLSIKRG